MVNISELANNLKLDNGVWVSKINEEIYYPSDANKVYEEIEENSFWFKQRNKFLIEAIKKFASKPKLFADVGGGNGFTAREIQRHGFETILIEPGKFGIESAKKRGVTHLINSSLHVADFRNEVFQNIGLFDVVEHIKDDVTFLKEINRILTVDGVVFVTVPAFEGLWSQNDDNAQHYRRYTLSTFSAMAKKAGLKTIYSTYFFSLLPIAIFIFRSLPYKLGIRYGSIYKKAANEHKEGPGSVIMKWMGLIEMKVLRKNQKLICGSSCLIVLRKIQNDY